MMSLQFAVDSQSNTSAKQNRSSDSWSYTLYTQPSYCTEGTDISFQLMSMESILLTHYNNKFIHQMKKRTQQCLTINLTHVHQ